MPAKWSYKQRLLRERERLRVTSVFAPAPVYSIPENPVPFVWRRYRNLRSALRELKVGAPSVALADAAGVGLRALDRNRAERFTGSALSRVARRLAWNMEAPPRARREVIRWFDEQMGAATTARGRRLI